MTMTAIVISIIIGLAVNESCELSPWIARKLVRWSACHRYTAPTRAETQAEELCSLIDDRPGKLLKLLTAFGFVIVTAMMIARRLLKHSMRHSAELTPKQLTPQQLQIVRDICIKDAGRLGLPHKQAELLADALVGFPGNN